ncbi:MAG: DUF3098 domain-containing protein [Tannerellaceae bacterium]|nr:DUF3098 domain-containing protein [Tannerellaceae bacterium]
MAKKDFAFNHENFIWLGASVILIIIGFLLMSGGGSEDGVSFNPEIFSKRRIVLAPFITFMGFIMMIFAILKTSKNEDNNKKVK